MAIDLLTEFADAEEVLRKLLQATLPAGVTVVAATGPIVKTPTVMARRIGGDCDRVTDFATMLVSCLCDTRPQSSALAATVQAIILNATNTAIVLADGRTALIDGASVVVADHPELYDNPDLRVVSASFELRMRRPWSASR